MATQINRDVGVFAELGYESLRFGGLPPTRIDDMVWAFGTTVTPNPDSEITISYGHKNGFNAISFNGSYAVTARTRISARYDTGLQSDLQNIQNQLDLAALDTNGNAVDAQTGAPLFIGGGGLGVQNGLFRTKAFTLSANTVLDRDQFSLSLQISEQTTVALAPSNLVASNPFAIPPPPVGQSSNAKTASLSWAHAFSEALSMVCSASYSTAQQSSTGTLNSIGANVCAAVCDQTRLGNQRAVCLLRPGHPRRPVKQSTRTCSSSASANSSEASTVYEKYLSTSPAFPFS